MLWYLDIVIRILSMILRILPSKKHTIWLTGHEESRAMRDVKDTALEKHRLT